MSPEPTAVALGGAAKIVGVLRAELLLGAVAVRPCDEVAAVARVRLADALVGELLAVLLLGAVVVRACLLVAVGLPRRVLAELVVREQLAKERRAAQGRGGPARIGW